MADAPRSHGEPRPALLSLKFMDFAVQVGGIWEKQNRLNSSFKLSMWSGGPRRILPVIVPQWIWLGRRNWPSRIRDIIDAAIGTSTRLSIIELVTGNESIKVPCENDVPGGSFATSMQSKSRTRVAESFGRSEFPRFPLVSFPPFEVRQ